MLGFVKRPEFVLFPRAVGTPDRHIVTVSVTADQCLSSDELQLMSAYGKGVRYWWLMHRLHKFAALDLPLGDTPFTRELLLPAGHYTIGVGRRPVERRLRFEITSDGSLVTVPPLRTDAHGECT